MAGKEEIYQAPCDKCGGKCCEYVAIEIDRPRTKKDYDHIRWYLVHKKVHVFVDHDRKWYVEFRSPCERLQKDKRCSFYNDRPKICRDHGNMDGECEYFDSPYTHYFKTVKQFERFLKKKGIDWKYKVLK
jgi:Fe-S-cluster containining protein